MHRRSRRARKTGPAWHRESSPDRRPDGGSHRAQRGLDESHAVGDVLRRAPGRAFPDRQGGSGQLFVLSPGNGGRAAAVTWGNRERIPDASPGGAGRDPRRPADQAQIPKGSNVLVGRVLEMATDAPVGGAVVTLTVPDPEIRAPQRPALRNVMTTPDGAFVFRDLPAGKYTIITTAFGYFRADYPPHFVELKDGSKPIAISLRVWKYGSISGRVFDERGEPVVGAPVHALKRLSIGGALVLHNNFPAAETDDRGVYQLANLPPGRYVVAVLASSVSVPASLAETISATAPNSTARFQLTSALLPGGARQAGGDGLHMADFVLQRTGPAPVVSPDGRVFTCSNTLYPGTEDAAVATIITLGSGEARTDLDIPIRFLPAVRVSGLLTGPTGPVKDVAVRLVSPAAADIDSLEPAGIASAVTDASGRFMFLGVPAGQYTLRASFVAFPSQASPGLSLSANQPFTVGDSDVTGLQLVMKPGAGISGSVEFKAAAGTPDSAYERVSITLRPIAASSWRALPGDVRPDGTFAAGGLAPGRHEVYAASAGGWRVVNVTSGGRPASDYVIDLGDREISGVVVTLSNASRRLSGTVADTRGVADADADVIIFPADTTVWREGIFQSRRVQRVRASSGGAFEMGFLAPGEYYVTAVSTRHGLEWEDPLFLERLLPGATKVTLADGDDKLVTLTTFAPKR